VAQKTHKTPEELEQAVGEKIDELFGDLFEEETPRGSEERSAPVESAAARVEASARPAVPAAGPSSPLAEKRPIPPPPKAAPKPPSPPAPPTSTARITAERRAGDTFENVAEQMEILILNLEWEVSPDSVSGLIKKFKELERFFPVQKQARTILAMNQRGLQQFAAPDSVPHPSLVKLLQHSLAALKLIRISQGRQLPSNSLITSITASYKEIMGGAPVSEAPAKERPGRVEEDRRLYSTLINNVGAATHSLEEVSQRLARILGVLRQGGGVSTEEITRRLGSLEHLLSERVGHLRSYHKELASMSAPVGDSGGSGDSAPGKAAPDGLLMVSWEGIHLAIPSSSVSALYPLSRSQAQQFADKPTITLGSRQLHRLPLKRPQRSDTSAKPPPNWLIHLSTGRKEYFLLAERTLGFRGAPKGVDISRQTRIKIGSASYALLNIANFR
jgi:hypothetical protein